MRLYARWSGKMEGTMASKHPSGCHCAACGYRGPGSGYSAFVEEFADVTPEQIAWLREHATVDPDRIASSDGFWERRRKVVPFRRPK